MHRRSAPATPRSKAVGTVRLARQDWIGAQDVAAEVEEVVLDVEQRDLRVTGIHVCVAIVDRDGSAVRGHCGDCDRRVIPVM